MSDIDDENELLMVTGRKAGKKRRKPTESDDEEPAKGSKRGKQGAMDDDSDDGLTEQDRVNLEKMNELERELFLYEREEQLQKARLGKAVLEQTRSKDEQVRLGFRVAFKCCLMHWSSLVGPVLHQTPNSSSLPTCDCLPYGCLHW